MAKKISESVTTRDRVRSLLSEGVKPRQIALALGISTQAVYKHKKRIDSETEPEEAAS
jgi:hypothetical protein